MEYSQVGKASLFDSEIQRFESFYSNFSERGAVGSVSVLGTEGHVFKSRRSDFKWNSVNW